MPPDSAARDALALVPQLQLLEVFLGALARQAALDAVEAGLVDDDGHAASRTC